MRNPEWFEHFALAMTPSVVVDVGKTLIDHPAAEQRAGVENKGHAT